MKSFSVMWLGILVVVVATLIERGDAAALNCQDSSKQCSTNDNCCSGCCQHGICTRQAACLPQQQGACAFHQCPRDKECYLQKVQCVTAPCNPVPLCRSKDPDYE